MARKLMFREVEATYNPVVGCTHKCVYCWARRLASTRLKRHEYYQAFEEPKLILRRLNRIPSGKLVFVTDMGDLFCDAVPDDWIYKVLHAIEEHSKPGQKFLFLTKNPIRYLDFLKEFNPERDYLGITIETDLDYSHFKTYISEAPSPVSRLYVAKYLRKKWRGVLFVSIEPVLDFTLRFAEELGEISPDYVEIGYDNWNNNLPEPILMKTELLIEKLGRFTKVNRKGIRRAWYEEDE